MQSDCIKVNPLCRHLVVLPWQRVNCYFVILENRFYTCEDTRLHSLVSVLLLTSARKINVTKHTIVDNYHREQVISNTVIHFPRIIELRENHLT